jgi:Leucine-rich repeat (LRR) protein
METKMLIKMLIAGGLLFSANTYSAVNCQQTDITGIPQSECQALMALYTATNGKDWFDNTNWDTPTPCHTWYGVSVEGNTVIGLSLTKNNLVGILPSELVNLNNLFSLELVSNKLSGQLPTFLPQLQKLKEIYLDDNHFEGNIPAEYGNFNGLVALWMGVNQLGGSIPPELAKNKELRSLVLGGNILIGSIPPELGNLSFLKRLALDNNHLSGQIPPELSKLQNLEYLLLFSNHLEGYLPPEFGNLSNLLVFDIDLNSVGGTIPPEWGKLEKLYRLDFDFNNLTGTIPPEMGNMTALTDLYMRYNKLSGTIPPELGNLTKLQKFFIEHQYLSGEIPRSFGQLKELKWLYLHDNQLSGKIPSELGQLPKLERLYLQRNNLSGEIPNNFKQLTKLTDKNGINLRYNKAFTNDSALTSFLSEKHTALVGNLLLPPWTQTLTLPVTNLVATTITDTSVTLTWQTQPFAFDNLGFYRIWYLAQEGGNLIASGVTQNKATTTYTVTNLAPNTTYYFALETYTPAHQAQQNHLISDFSFPLKATTKISNTQITSPSNRIFIQSLVDDKNQAMLMASEKNSAVMIVPETNQKYSLVVNREGDLESEVTVEWSIQPLSSDEYVDYKFPNDPQGILTFKPKESSKTIALEIKDDFEEEDAEIIRVYLFNPSKNATLGIDNALITIKANDPPTFRSDDWIVLRVGDLYSNYLRGGKGLRFVSQAPDPKIVKLYPYQGGDFLRWEAIGPGKTTMTLSDSTTPPQLVVVEIFVSVPVADRLDFKHPPYQMRLQGDNKRTANIVLPMEVPNSDHWIEDKELFFIIQFPFNQPADQFWQVSKVNDTYQLTPFNNSSPFLTYRKPDASMNLSKELKNVSGFDFTNLNLSPAHGGFNFDGRTINVYEGFTDEERSQMVWTWYQIVIE